MHLENILRKPVWVIPDSSRGKSFCGTAFTQGHGWTAWIMKKDEEIHCIPQRDLTLDENNKLITLYSVNYYKIL